MTVVSQEGRGILTITDVRYTDAGAYTCEAINNRGSIFAIPDALVIVRRKLYCECSITKTCLYSFDPLKPHFYIVKLGFTGV